MVFSVDKKKRAVITKPLSGKSLNAAFDAIFPHTNSSQDAVFSSELVSAPSTLSGSASTQL